MKNKTNDYSLDEYYIQLNDFKHCRVFAEDIHYNGRHEISFYIKDEVVAVFKVWRFWLMVQK